MTAYGGTTALKGALGVKKISGTRKAPLSWKLRNALRWYFIWGMIGAWAAQAMTKIFGIPAMIGALQLVLIKANGERVDYGLVGRRVVTTAFVNFVVDQLQTETSAFGDFLYHDSGEGNTAENVTDTDIETTDGESRATGNQGEGASANIYQSVGTISYTSTLAIVEHGLFNASTSGTLMDRTVFSAVNVVNGDSIQFTYQLTVTAGS